jgi:glycosyltransferase involved in cell wall biosynthesis
MNAGVSIIMCCYNSVPRLPVTLQHLLAQKITGHINWEIIVVDNASTDETTNCATQILTNAKGIDYAIVYEAESGLSSARKKGYTVAKYEYLVFCDDDNWLAENYIQLGYKTMEENPKIGILGGRGDAVFEGPEPFWFKDFMIDFAVGEQPGVVEILSPVKEVYGAGFIIRKTYLDQLYGSGFKSILSDRKGEQLISGGDVELCYVAPLFGYEIWYCRDLNFKHLMTRPRLSWNYMKRLYDGNGRTNVYMRAYQYFQVHNTLPGQNLRYPFWLDTLIHKVKYIFRFYPQVKGKMHKEGDADVLMFIAMKAEAQEIWKLKGGYSAVYEQILKYLQSIKSKSNPV